MTTTNIVRGNIRSARLIGLPITPTALTASTTTALTFALPGVGINNIITGSFPGAQTAGVGIANMRMSASEVLEITFSNSTAGTPTPAAGLYNLIVYGPDGLPLPVNGV